MHFSVMVFGYDVEKQLAPFQETNMGPIAPEYMEKIDYTQEVVELFHARQQYFRLSDGRYVEFGPAHHRDPAGKFVLIPGAVAVETAEHFGATREGDRFFVEDNFNSTWDSWVVGGRWASMLKLIPGQQGYTATPLEFDPAYARILNMPEPGVWEPKPGYCDQARKKDIDWIGMAAEAGEKAGAEWDLVRSWTKGSSWSTWAEVRGKFGGDVARDHYGAQPAIKAIREAQATLPPEERRWFIDDAWSGTREDYVAAAEASAGVTYAAVVNGVWLQRDMVDDDAVRDWNRLFRTILDQMPDEVMVTIIDCHV